MAYTTYSAAQAATRAKQYTTWRINYCLNFVRNMLTPTVSSPFGGLPDAITAWNKAQKKVTSGTPPAGAPVYWRTFSHPYGHVAISLGGGYCRSTDWPSKGRVGTVAISRITSAWGMRYLGWSRDYAGLTIRGLESTTAAAIPAPPNYSEATAYIVNDEALRAGVRSSAARMFNARVWSWLYWHGGTSGRNWCTSNYKAWMAESGDVFGTMTAKAMNKMYQILDGGTPNYTYPGPALLRRLGMRAD